MKRVDDEETVQVFSFSEIGEGSTKIPHFLHIEKSLARSGCGRINKTNRVIAPAQIQLFHIFMSRYISHKNSFKYIARY